MSWWQVSPMNSTALVKTISPSNYAKAFALCFVLITTQSLFSNGLLSLASQLKSNQLEKLAKVSSLAERDKCIVNLATHNSCDRCWRARGHGAEREWSRQPWPRRPGVCPFFHPPVCWPRF